MYISTKVFQAIEVATFAYKDQKRKYTNDSYIIHPLRVMRRVFDYYENKIKYPNSQSYKKFLLANEYLLMVAVLHDVLEDTSFPASEIEAIFGLDVKIGVFCLTNPSKNHPELPREQRKKMDREHLAQIDKCWQIIKLFDRIDNILDLKQAKPDFKRLYITETVLLMDALKNVDRIVLEELNSAVLELSNTI